MDKVFTSMEAEGGGGIRERTPLLSQVPSVGIESPKTERDTSSPTVMMNILKKVFIAV
jgi:hypothetical protein